MVLIHSIFLDDYWCGLVFYLDDGTVLQKFGIQTGEAVLAETYNLKNDQYILGIKGLWGDP